MNDIKGSADGLQEQLTEHRTALETASRDAIETMNREAAEARTRMEGGLDATRVNAETEIARLRETGEQVKARLDGEYQNAMGRFADDLQHLGEVRKGLTDQLESTYERWGDNLKTWVEEHASAANQARETLETTQAWAESIMGGVQIAALAEGFHLKELDHRKRARNALIASGSLAVVGFVSVLVAFWLFYSIKPAASPSEVARDLALRAVLAAIPFTASAFSARVYRTHSHLATVYGERAAAAKAFEGFAKRASSPTVADELLVALAQLVFAGRDTGHHAEEQIVPAAAATSVFSRLLSGK